MELDRLRTYTPFPRSLISIVDLTYSEGSLVYFQVFGNLTPDEIVSNYRMNQGGACGYATHILIDGHKALACADCTGVCRWTVHLFEPGRECLIDVEMPVIVNSDGYVPPLDDGAYLKGDFPLLSIIRTVRCDPPKGKPAIMPKS